MSRSLNTGDCLPLLSEDAEDIIFCTILSPLSKGYYIVELSKTLHDNLASRYLTTNILHTSQIRENLVNLNNLLNTE